LVLRSDDWDLVGNFCIDYRGALLCLCLAFMGGVLAAHAEPRVTGNGEGAVAPHRTLAFDIPEQALSSALETYSVASGREVVYNGALAEGRRSARVVGMLTPDAALQALLEGTGLATRYMSDDAFVLVPHTVRDRVVNTAPPLAVARYYARIQDSLRRAFCADARLRPGGYRVALSFWIDASGMASSAVLLSSTGDRRLDGAIEATMRAVSVGEPPPPGFGQPIAMIVAPYVAGMTRDCREPEAQRARLER
jgi:TonB family protein